jgi:hypothetical protein
MGWEGYFHWSKAAECEADRSLARMSASVAPFLHVASCSEQGQNKLLFEFRMFTITARTVTILFISVFGLSFMNV